MSRPNGKIGRGLPSNRKKKKNATSSTPSGTNAEATGARPSVRSHARVGSDAAVAASRTKRAMGPGWKRMRMATNIRTSVNQQ